MTLRHLKNTNHHFDPDLNRERNLYFRTDFIIIQKCRVIAHLRKPVDGEALIDLIKYNLDIHMSNNLSS